jgi:hypothetical protein
MKSLILRYIGQNSTAESSDVKLEELRDMNDMPWIQIWRLITEMHEDGIIYQPSKRDWSVLKLTVRGRKDYELASRETNKVTVIPMRDFKLGVEAGKKKLENSGEPNLKRTNIIIDDKYFVLYDCKVALLNAADKLTFAGESNCKLTPAQDKQFSRWQDKFTNWESFPRK